jgi:hypothetical protein
MAEERLRTKLNFREGLQGVQANYLLTPLLFGFKVEPVHATEEFLVLAFNGFL